MNRLQMIRKSEKEYHDHCYENIELFQPGSWMHKPVQTVMELLPIFEHLYEVNVLDLGSGVGRNSIPVASYFKEKEGKVVCVDLLESAMEKLAQYSEQYNVREKIQPVMSDISKYHIPSDYFDLIISVSSLEHLESERVFDEVIHNMIKGTNSEGIHCMIISTRIKETVLETGESIDPMYELMFETDRLIEKLKQAYCGWNTLKFTVKPYGVEIVRDGRHIKLESDVVTWVVQKED